MPAKSYFWGTPPWTIHFRPRVRPIPTSVDFVVVGGGFSGLSAAAWLKKLAPSKSVLLLEAEKLGNGASGRTGGMALAESAAGDLPGLGDVLGGYRRILRALRIDAELSLPGAFELGRSGGLPHSPIHWNDSGDLRVVKKIPGGTVHPGKVIAGLARAAQSAGAQIAECAEVVAITQAREESAGTPLQVEVRLRNRAQSSTKSIGAHRVLLATNAFSLGLSDLTADEPKLTMALASAPLTRHQIRSLGLESRRPFYTTDLPYLWGRLMRNNAAIFGAGLVHAPKERALHKIDIRKGEAAERLAWLESRVRNLHPSMENVRVTHLWGGPLLLTEGAKPVFRTHPRLPQVTILAGFNGHGVALSIYLGRWAAQSLLGRRQLPTW